MNADEIVQYLVVNRDLKMSPGKIGAQVAHGATITALAALSPNLLSPNRGARALNEQEREWFRTWNDVAIKKIVLGGHEEDLHKLLEQGAFPVRDAGYTEIAPGSLTVVFFPPMPRSVAKPLIGHLRTL